MLCENLPIAIKLWRSGPDEVIDAGVMNLKSGLMCSEGVFSCISCASLYFDMLNGLGFKVLRPCHIKVMIAIKG